MMEEHPENSAEQPYHPDAIPVDSLGRMLREERERIGLSLADVANQIKFATRQIEALEADDFQRLQGATFLRGFVRSYAKILQLDVQPLLELLPTEKPAPQEVSSTSVEMPFPSMWSSRRQNLIWSGAAILLAVILVGFGIWQSTSPRSLTEIAQEQIVIAPTEMKITEDLSVTEERIVPLRTQGKSTIASAQSVVPETDAAIVEKSPPSVIVEESTQSTSQEEPPRSRALLPISSLRLVFEEESWVEIKDRDDNIMSSSVNQPGSELRLEGNSPFFMLIGNAASVRLYQDEEEVDLTLYTHKNSGVAHVTLE